MINTVFLVRISFHGDVITEQADPFAVYADVCEVSNNANFDDVTVTTNAEDISLKFIDSK